MWTGFRCVALVVAVLALSAAPAAGFYFAEVTYPDGSWAHQEDQWVREASVPPADVEVVVEWRRCPVIAIPDGMESLSCAKKRGRRWRIWMDPAIPAPQRPRIFAHEMFHVRDGAAGPKLNRVRKSLRTINGWGGSWYAPQWPSVFGPTLPASPAERAADASSWCAVTPRSQWSSFEASAIGVHDYGWRPTSAQFVATCRALLRGR